MGILGRTIFREITVSASLGTILFTFVLFLQKVNKVFEILVKGSADASTVGYLFALLLPPALVFTIPIGTLVGVLIALNRMSADGEIIALRAAGVPSQRIVTPVMAVALLGFCITLLCSTVLTPWATRQQFALLNQMIAAQLTAEIQPRIFEEQFPNTILYVGDVAAGRTVRWKNIFMADLTPPAERKGSQEQSESPVITVADSAVAVPDLKNNTIHLALEGVNTYEVGKSFDNYYKTSAPHTDQILEAQKRSEVHHVKGYLELDMGPLYALSKTEMEARIEFHQRLALPFACLLLALVGVPLGVSSKKGGKSAAFVLTVLLALAYYTAFLTLTKLAQQRSMPVWLAVWLPDMILSVFAVAFIQRLERPGDRDIIGQIRHMIQRFLQRSQQKLKPSEGRELSRLPVFAQIIDTYVLSGFLYYFGLMLFSFVLMIEVFTFFELLSDMFQHKIPMSKMFSYLAWLAPKLIYDSTPVSVLVAVLVTFGIMSKQNEVTAFKATGVSLHRLALPIVVMCGIVSVALFAFDYDIVPSANVRQDALRDEIKGRPAQTYLRPDRKWIRGEANRIYYYKIFEGNEMLGVNVYELDNNNKLRRAISAERARWEPGLKTWVFQNGWMREIQGKHDFNYTQFTGTTATFPGLTEQPSYFLKEVKQDKQMNFRELSAYIRELRQSGFDTVRLQVQLHKKFAMPLFAMIMSMIAIPFAFGTGNRGAMTSVGVSFIIAICYWTVVTLFEQVGNVNQLPAALAAWSPDLLFSLAGMYFLARMRT